MLLFILLIFCYVINEIMSTKPEQNKCHFTAQNICDIVINFTIKSYGK
jgi:hypothetical protein